MRIQPFRYSWQKLAAFGFDVAVSGAAMWFAVAITKAHSGICAASGCFLIVTHIFLFTAVAAVSMYFQRLYRCIWRYTSFSDCVVIFSATAATLVVYTPIASLLSTAQELPRESVLIAGLCMMAFLAAPRILIRAFADRRIPAPFAVRVSARPNAVPILLVGKAERSETYVRSLQRLREPPYVVIGILTEDPAWHGRTMHGIGVLGAPEDIGDALNFLSRRKLFPQRLVIADDQIDKDGIALCLDLAGRHGLTLGRVPRLTDLRGAGADTSVQPIAIGDLLDRPQIIPDCTGLRNLIRNKRVLITGAGGSIGSELVRQLSEMEPARLVLVENTEFNLYAIDHELSVHHAELDWVPVICDVRDRAALNKCFSENRPDIVFHAAALKHVPMVECNPIQGIHTNALGTQNVADACTRYGVLAMVLISTDKAVNPPNVMGASKRCAEAYCQALDMQGGLTRFVSVRFGNVLGSTGSVVPLFQQQLAEGGPVTVTDPNIERFFMTIPEAVRLVLQASVLGASKRMPRGRVYVLDMGSPVKIADLARRMIRLAGKEPDKDIKIVYTGLRPGEKLYEEVTHAQETLAETPVHGVMMVSPRTSDLPIVQHQFAALAQAVAAFDCTKALSVLCVIVPEYKRSESIMALVEEATAKAVSVGSRNAGGRRDDDLQIPVPLRAAHPFVKGDGTRGRFGPEDSSFTQV